MIEQVIARLKAIYKWGYEMGYISGATGQARNNIPKKEEINDEAKAIADIDPWTRVEDGLPEDADCMHGWYVCEIVIDESVRYVAMTWHDLASSMKFRGKTNGITRYQEITPPKGL